MIWMSRFGSLRYVEPPPDIETKLQRRYNKIKPAEKNSLTLPQGLKTK